MQRQCLVQLAHQGFADFRIGRHHAADATVEVRDDDDIAFTGQPGAQILDLRVQPPQLVQQDEAGINPFFLRPKLNTFHLDVFHRAGFDVRIHHRVRQRRNGDPAWETARPGADLLQREGSGRGNHHGPCCSCMIINIAARPVRPGSFVL